MFLGSRRAARNDSTLASLRSAEERPRSVVGEEAEVPSQINVIPGVRRELTMETRQPHMQATDKKKPI